MKKQNDEADELREHYNFDYGKAKPDRFANRFSQESVAAVPDPDVAAVSPIFFIIVRPFRAFLHRLLQLCTGRKISTCAIDMKYSS